MTILTPEEFFKKKGYITTESIYAFIMSMTIGILTHLYPLTHRFFIVDYHYAYRENLAWQIRTGRWFMAYFTSYIDGYIAPALSTLIGIFFYALVVVTLVKAFKIKEKFIIFVFSAIIMAFPAVATAFGYMITLENSSTSIFLSIFSFYLANKSRKYAIIGALPLCLSLGGYQAYIALPITLCLISLLLLTLENEITIKMIVNKMLDFLLLGIIGVGLYFFVTKAILIYNNAEMVSYVGLDKMGQIPLASMPGLFFDSYKGYVYYIFGKRFLYASVPIVIVNLIFILINIYLFTVCFIRSKVGRNPYKAILSLVFFLLLPFAANSLDFLSNNQNTILGAIPFVFMYLLPFILISRFNLNSENDFHTKVLKLNTWVISICILIMIFDFIKISNIHYHKVEIAYGDTIGIINRMITKIDETEGFNYNVPIAFAGSLQQSSFYNYDFLFDYKETEFMRGVGGQYFGLSQEKDILKFVNICNNYFGTRYKMSNIDLDKIKATEAYKDMQEYPKDNSMKIIDGTLIIKLSYVSYVDYNKINSNTYSFRYETDDKSFDHKKYTYAWYVYEDGVPIKKVWYEDNDIYTYQFNEKGEYRVKVFVRNKETKITEVKRISDFITVQ